MLIARSKWMPAIREIDETTAICAIGDVHGCADLLKEMHAAVAREFDLISPGAAYCVHLGDLIDRGPESVRALTLAMQGIPGATNCTLIGNHEHRLLQLLRAPDVKMMERWLTHGGTEFFEELGVDPRDGWEDRVSELLGRHTIEWLHSLPFKLQLGNLLFVHAGIDVEVPIDRQTAETLAWIREPWLSSAGPYENGLAVIHGHTPIADVVLSNRHRINLDTGACETGVLSALLIHGRRMKLFQTG
ncbi:metallophosphoesterase [Rhizobium binae]|uniref:metallophosphoesterase n=2 Tax=Rhizobium binae TaxID=1138190 RepID=UPI001C83669C|nr:metallophosphoesterase [Rhizobium binae]MBX4940625.1 serine/threonine protein phosphatase [Rhizobium binae]MBX4947154.1 serine/threonine protein phosphatase [Rhizobium binae]MBX4960250.1 serine/threonine protein phosphatase [Rhizobium binae]MBX4983048.1 serine/threonine protein phosphatase [Rhizobium binae]